MNALKFTLVCLATASMGGCGAAPEPEDALDSESVDEIDLAIGEAGCGTYQPITGTPSTNGQVFRAPAKGGCWSAFGTTSPNASYNPTGCPNQYITEVTNTANRWVDFFVAWGDTALTSSNCSNAKLQLKAYRHLNTPTETPWVPQNGERHLKGSWTGWSCEFVPDTGDVPIEVIFPYPIFDKVRVVGKATLKSFLVTSKKRVSTRVLVDDGPC